MYIYDLAFACSSVLMLWLLQVILINAFIFGVNVDANQKAISDLTGKLYKMVNQIFQFTTNVDNFWKYKR